MSFTLDTQLQADTILLASLPLCELLLMNDSQYPWFILVPRRADLRELMELSAMDRAQYTVESDFIADFLQAELLAEKINIAALGNVVAQLHIHHIARFSSDSSWPRPVWGVHDATAYTHAELDDLYRRLHCWAVENWAVDSFPQPIQWRR